MTLSDLKEEVRVRWMMAPQELKTLCVALAISFGSLAINLIGIYLETRIRAPKPETYDHPTLISFDDSVNADALPVNQSYGIYYADGDDANYDAVRERLGAHALLIGITVEGQVGPSFQACDCETGDLTVAQTVEWVQSQIDADAPLIIVYASQDTWEADGLLTALEHHGDRIKRHIAAYNGQPSVPAGYDAHQWAGNVPGKNGGLVDKNVALSSYFDPYVAPITPTEAAQDRRDIEDGLRQLKQITISELPADQRAELNTILTDLRKLLH